MSIWMWNVFEPSLQNGHMETMDCQRVLWPIRIHSIHRMVHRVTYSAHPRFMRVPAGHVCFSCRKCCTFSPFISYYMYWFHMAYGVSLEPSFSSLLIFWRTNKSFDTLLWSADSLSHDGSNDWDLLRSGTVMRNVGHEWCEEFPKWQPLPMHLVSQFSHRLLVAAPFIWRCVWPGRWTAVVHRLFFHFVPCFPAVPLDPEMVNQRGFSMEIHRNPMRFGHFSPKFAASCATSIWGYHSGGGRGHPTAGSGGSDAALGVPGFPMALVDHMQNGEIAMEELENMSFCIFYHIQKMPDDGHIRFFLGSDGSHCTRSTMDCNREIVELTLLGAYSEILSCSRKWRAAAARLGRNQWFVWEISAELLVQLGW